MLETVDDLREADTDRVQVGAGGEEASPMGCILDGVGECDELLVVVIGTGPGLLDGNGTHRGISYAQ